MNRKLKVLVIIAVICILLAILMFGVLDIANWHRLDVSKITGIQLSTRVFDHEGQECAALSGAQQRLYTALEELPEYVPLAFVAAEDARFFEHSGVDVRRIFGALMSNIRSGSYGQGASTITQQLIKLTHLTSEKTLARKAQEAWLALRLERALTKEEILEAYLNTVYFGGGAYGIGAAARRYFDKEASELSLGEAALLAGVIKSPSNYAPHIDPDAAAKRQRYVLESMAREGCISHEEADAAADAIVIREYKSTANEQGWYTDAVAREAVSVLGISHEELLGGGYSIYTALDTVMQHAAESVMAEEAFFPEAGAQGAIVAIEPGSGEIRAVAGGREYSVRLGLDRAYSARRQPGSLIKPLSTYAAAVEKHGYLPVSTLYDVRREYPGGYAPGNSGGNYYGNITMRDALARSLNAATVDLADTVGVRAIADSAAAFGIPIEEGDMNLALALGAMTHGATPMEMCAAYAALAAGGIYSTPHTIREIVDRYGRTVYKYEAANRRCVSEETACILTDMLKTAVSSGTARSLSAPGIPVAGKTGTAGLENGDTSDAWAAAYTPDIAVTVWIGKDSNSDGGMAKSVTGGGYAAPACAEFLKICRSRLSGEDFSAPAGLTRLLIDGFALNNESRVLLASDDTPMEYVRAELFRPGSTFDVSDIWETPPPVGQPVLTSGRGEIPVIEFTGTGRYSEYLIVRSCRGKSDIVGVVQCPPGERAVFTDTAADVSQINTYSVIPRHTLLFSRGKTLLGPESGHIEARPAGLLNGITSYFTPDETDPVIESLTDPLF